MHTQLLSNLAELDARRPQWQALWQRDAHATPFQAPAWLLPWARHFAPDRIRALALHEDDRLVVLLPFFTWEGKLLLAGTGPSDYGDGVFADRSNEVATHLLDGLVENADALHCEVIDLQQLPRGSPLLRAATSAGWRSETSAGDVCPVAPLMGEGLDGIAASQRKNLAYAARSLQRQGPWTMRLARTDELDAVVARIAALHAQRWGAREASGIFADARMHSFIAAALPELAAADILRLHLLEVRDEIIAAAIVMHAHASACLYSCTFDTRWSRYSPGVQVIAGAMRHAASEGATQFDFLRGQEPYKYRLGGVDMQPQRRRLHRA